MKTIFGAMLVAFSSLVFAQEPFAPNPTQSSPGIQQGATVPVYSVTVIGRTVKAVNYRHRSGSTKVDFRGTALMPEARGEVEVQSKQGILEVEAEMERMEPATKFGPEYLTYVMWAITPEGRATNLGEVLLNDGESKLNTSSELQSFGLIVTAEPYFGVTQPSDVVVMENFVRSDTKGAVDEIEAKYELLQRGQYTLNVAPSELVPLKADKKVPLELLQARNAVRIARWTGAAYHAPDTFQKAVQGLGTAEGYLEGKQGSKPIGTVAREVVQMAEDARIITVRRIEEQRLARERADAAAREARARAEADAEVQRRLQADADRAAAERAKSDAERAQLQAQAASNMAMRDREEAEKQRAAADRQRAEAEAARAAALAQQQAAQAEAERARQAAAESERLRLQAEQNQAALRSQLLQQLNLVLETRDSARGLIVNMSDVLFDTARYTLRPGAREKLAKIAGIVIAHPSLKLEVEGHTDSVGSEEYNQTLSENRANSVRGFLVEQGISPSNITAKGFGEGTPVASNDTAIGRQQNRRVELVVSGDIIDSATGTAVGLR